MLSRAEICKLFDLLRELHGKDKPRDGRTVAIWTEVLKPWDYPQVRTAALTRARENRYYPAPAELTAYLPKAPRSTPAGATAPQATGVSDAIAKAKWEDLRAAWGEQIKERRMAGIPATLGEAKRAGMSVEEWQGRVEELERKMGRRGQNGTTEEVQHSGGTEKGG